VKRWLAAFGTIVAVCVCSRAGAEGRPRIVVLDGHGDGAVAQLRAELEAIGFDVIADEHTEAAGHQQLEQVARSASAVAAIRLVRSRSGVEVWIADRATGKLVLREVMSAELAAGGDRTLVLRAVELLRASLLEVDEPHPPRGDAPVTKGLREAAHLPERRTATKAAAEQPPAPAHPLPEQEPASRARALHPTLELGPAVFVSPGGLAPMLHARLALDLGVGRFGATVWMLLPTIFDRLAGPEGTVDVRVFLPAAGGRVELGPRRVPWSVVLGTGAALAWIETRGYPASNAYAGHIETALTGGPYLSTAFSYAVAPFASVDASVTGGLLLPPQHIFLGGRDAAHFGPAYLSASVGISFGDVDRGKAQLTAR
jgi:hypothetical protein